MSFPRYERYKDSGVEWLGKVPEHWQVRRLRYSARLVTEKATQQTNPLALENIESWTGRLLPSETKFEGDGTSFRIGDLLFGKLRPYLAKAYLAESEGEAVGDFHVMRPSPFISGRFLFHQLINRDSIALIDGSTFGSKMPRVGWDFMANMVLATPPIAEQVRVADFIAQETAKIDALIEEQRRLIELLKEKRQAVISHAVTKGLNPDAPMKDSEVEWMASIPVHWRVLSLGRITESACDGPFGSGLKSDHYVDAGIRVIRLQNIRDGVFDGTDAAFIDPVHYADLGDHDVISRDLLIAGLGDERNAVGRACVAPSKIEPAMVKADCFRFRLTHDALPEFVAAQLSIGAPTDAGRLATGSTRSRIPVSKMSSRPVAIPSVEEQSAIVSYLGRRDAEFAGLRSQAELGINLLQERRSALISAAVTGKIDVRNYTPKEAA